MSERVHVSVFFLVILFLGSWHLDQAQNANTVSRAATVAAIVEHGTFRIDRFAHLTGDKALVGGHYYSEKAPLPALVVVPFHWVLNRSGAVAPSTSDHINVDLLRLAGFLCGSLPFALIVVITWWHVRKNGYRIRPALLVLPAFFGSFLFAYSGSFYGHLIGALFLLLALVALERNAHAWAGALAGCAVLCEYALVIFPFCWVLGLLLEWGRTQNPEKRNMRIALLRFLAGGLPFAILLMAYNNHLFGGPLSVGYDHVAEYAPEGGSVIDHIRPEALWGLSFSLYRGLMPHMPLLMLALLAGLLKRPKWSALTDLRIAVPALLTFLLVASLGLWWGGWAFGPRHLTAVAVLLAYRLLPVLANAKWAMVPVLVLGTCGSAYVIAAKSTIGYAVPTAICTPLTDAVLPAVKSGDWTSLQWPVLLGISPLASTLLFITIFLTAVGLLTALDKPAPATHAPVPLS